jgi:hypothetical protein
MYISIIYIEYIISQVVKFFDLFNYFVASSFFL